MKKRKLKMKLPKKAAAQVVEKVGHAPHDYFSKLVTDRPLTPDELGTEADPEGLPFEQRMTFYKRRLGPSLFNSIFGEGSKGLTESEQLARLNMTLVREGYPALRRDPSLEPAALEATAKDRAARRAASQQPVDEARKAKFSERIAKVAAAHDDQSILVLVEGNPRREGTVARRLYDAMLKVATVGEYRKATEKFIHRSAMAYLMDSIKRKHIRLLEPGEAPPANHKPRPAGEKAPKRSVKTKKQGGKKKK